MRDILWWDHPWHLIISGVRVRQREEASNLGEWEEKGHRPHQQACEVDTG